MFNDQSIQKIIIEAKYISDGYGDWITEYEGTSRTEAKYVIRTLIKDDEVWDIRSYTDAWYTSFELRHTDIAANVRHKFPPCSSSNEDDLPF